MDYGSVVFVVKYCTAVPLAEGHSSCEMMWLHYRWHLERGKTKCIHRNSTKGFWLLATLERVASVESFH